jgi:hypothetical protein
MPLISLVLSSLHHLVLENPLALLIITVPSWSSREAGIGQARACPDTPETCQARGERALAWHWAPQYTSSPRQPRPPLQGLELRRAPPHHPLQARQRR